MKAVIQRVTAAAVVVEGKTVGKIEKGILLLAGFEESDNENELRKIARKAVRLRIFSDESGKMNLSVFDSTPGAILAVSNFTLQANCVHGRRPDFSGAAGASDALRLYRQFLDILRFEAKTVFEEKSIAFEPRIEEGVFGADMKLDIAADGPVTIILDSGDLI